MTLRANVTLIGEHTVPPSPTSNKLIKTTVVYYKGADKSLARPGRKQATATGDFDVHILFIIIIVGILVLFIYITRLASNEIVTIKKIYRKIGRAKELSAPR
jgi:hypothetical protein